MTMTLSKHAAAYYWQLCKVHGVRRVVMFLARVMRQANDALHVQPGREAGGL